ncbi:MAG: phosphotransferase [Actinomycetota bacterium]
MELRPRQVTLVLCRRDGEVLGRLDPFEVASPWRQEAAPVVDACVDRFGVRPVLLRLLDAEPEGPGGEVTYLAEVDVVPDEVRPWGGRLGDHALRMPWARPGGPATDLDWASGAIEAVGRRVSAPPTQVRTWNLSSLWRLPTDGGTVWLKAVPPFFAHEAAVLRLLDDQPVPELMAGEPGRAVLAHLEGEDGYSVGLPGWRRHVDALVGIQLAAVERTDALRAAGVPAVELVAVAADVRRLLDRRSAGIDGAVREVIESVLDDTDRIVDVVTDLVPVHTLVHGDAHTGNGRFVDGDVAILDWGDSFVGHPLLDVAVAESHHPELGSRIVEAWLERWRRAGFDRVGEAWSALRPLAHLRSATVFQHFLDHIEPSERGYHEHDVVPALVAASRRQG